MALDERRRWPAAIVRGEDGLGVASRSHGPAWGAERTHRAPFGGGVRVGREAGVEHVEHLATELAAGKLELGPADGNDGPTEVLPLAVEAHLVEQDPPDAQVQGVLLPRPARRERHLIERQQLGVAERPPADPVTEQAGLVIGIVEDQGVDPGGEAAGVPSAVARWELESSGSGTLSSMSVATCTGVNRSTLGAHAP